MAEQTIVKFLTASGCGSRRQMTEAIKSGRVKLNGRTVESYTQPVNPQVDNVTMDGKPVKAETGHGIYLVFNKPAGIVSSTRDEHAEKTVMDILPAKYKDSRVYPVGRLDKDSTGLILLTNDGELTYRLTHPKFEQEKEYLVHIEGRLKPEEKRKLETGIELLDGKTSPARIRELKMEPYNYSIIIHEGKKRQIRRMFGVAGHPVLQLKRIRMGKLLLDDLPEGAFRELTKKEVRSLLPEKNKTV